MPTTRAAGPVHIFVSTIESEATIQPPKRELVLSPFPGATCIVEVASGPEPFHWSAAVPFVAAAVCAFVLLVSGASFA